MAEIKWDRETCLRCSMVISDRRFAAQVRGGPQDMVFKFDDIGCFVFWIATEGTGLAQRCRRPHVGRRRRQQGRG